MKFVNSFGGYLEVYNADNYRLGKVYPIKDKGYWMMFDPWSREVQGQPKTLAEAADTLQAHLDHVHATTTTILDGIPV